MKEVGINNLRGIVALWVMLGHYEIIYYIGVNTTPKLFEIIKYFDPVAIFFLISGYLIPLSLKRYGSKEFLVRRLFRIFPVIIFCSSFHYFFIGGSFYNYINTLLLSFDVTKIKPQVSVYWSLSIEFYFYTIIAIFFLFTNKNILNSIIFGAFASIGIFLIFYALGNYYYMSVTSRYSTLLIYIFIGTIIYLYLENKKKYLIIIGLIFISVMYLMMQLQEYSNSLLFNEKFISEYPNGVFIISETLENRIDINDFFYSKIAALFIFMISIKFFKIKSRILNFLSDISFPIYIFHMTIYYLIFSTLHNIDKIYLIGISVALSLLSSWIIHNFIEKKANNYIKSR